MSPAGRPPHSSGLRERNRRARTERILEAARELLRERDANAVTLEQIADRAEVAPGTVFNLIGTRERLLGALIDQAHDQLAEALTHSAQADPLARVRTTIATLVDIFVADREVYRHVLKEWSDSGSTLRSSPYPPIRQALEEAQAAGLILPEIDLDRVAAAVLAGCVGALHQWSVEIIGDQAFRERCAYGADLALAAIASDSLRPTLLTRLARTRRPRR